MRAIGLCFYNDGSMINKYIQRKKNVEDLIKLFNMDIVGNVDFCCMNLVSKLLAFFAKWQWIHYTYFIIEKADLLQKHSRKLRFKVCIKFKKKSIFQLADILRTCILYCLPSQLLSRVRY